MIRHIQLYMNRLASGREGRWPSLLEALEGRFACSGSAFAPEYGPTAPGIPVFATEPNGLPVLNSLPGAAAAIYLDFDGQVPGPRTLPIGPYTEDSDGTAFNVAEQRSIYQMWRQMAAYFGIFDINVTTVMPTATTPMSWLVIGGTSASVGGTGLLNSFPSASPIADIWGSVAKTTPATMARAVGFTFGLTNLGNYDQWSAPSSTSVTPDPLHNPIMGNATLSGTVSKFVIARNATAAGAATLQDELATIASKIAPYQQPGGDGYRPDDFGGTIVTATPLSVSGSVYWTSGMIERLHDSDAFSFTVATDGNHTLSAAPQSPSGVDLKFSVYRADGTLLAEGDNVNNVQQLTLSLTSGTYYAVVSSHGNYHDLGSYFVTFSPMPEGWRSTEIGPGVSGYSVHDAAAGAFHLVSTGLGLSGTSDGLQYAYQHLTGNGSIVARVTNLDGATTDAMAGLSIRASTASNSTQVGIVRTTGSDARLILRVSNGNGLWNYATSPGKPAPVWLRLTRSGSTFTGSTSPDGLTWSQLGSWGVSMPSAVTIGLITSSGSDAVISVSQFDNVTVTGALGLPTPVYGTLPSPTGLAVQPSLGSSLAIDWDDVVGATGYTVRRSEDGSTYVDVASPTSSSYIDPDLPGSRRYFYQVQARNASGASIPSAPIHVTNRPSAVTNLSISSTTSQLVLNWRETTGESGYRIERATDGVNFIEIATVGANVPGYTDANLTSSTRYSYRVIPTSALGDGAVSAVVSRSPHLSPVTPTIGNVAVGSIAINWTAISNHTEYRIERSADNVTFEVLTTVPGDVTTYTDTAVTSAQKCYYRVYGVTSVSQSSPGGVAFAAAPSATPPPAPWVSREIGVHPGPGTTHLENGIFTLVSSGGEISYASDSFRMTSQSHVGDAEIRAYVESIESNPNGAMGGVMIRESDQVDSPYAFMYRSGNTIFFKYRSVKGASATAGGFITTTTPRWLRLVRAGNTFYGAYSTNGENWTTLGTANIAMTPQALAGIAATSNSTTTLRNFVFSNVALSDDIAPLVNGITRTGGNVTNASSVQFAVNFSENVTGVDPSDFALTLSGTTGTIQSVTGSGSAYVVTAVGVGGNGTLGLNLVDNDTIIDASGKLLGETGAGNGSLTGQTYTIDTTPPVVLKWESVGTHARGVGDVALLIPDNGSFSEPRNSGIRSIRITFNSAIDAALLSSSAVGVWGNYADSQPVDLFSINVATSFQGANTVAVVSFSEKLPDFARYLIRLTGVRDPAGNGLSGDNDRILTALLGDITGDLRVNSTDVGAVTSLRGIDPINSTVINEVRSDVTNDGRINSTDVGAVTSSRGRDARLIPDPIPPTNLGTASMRGMRQYRIHSMIAPSITAYSLSGADINAGHVAESSAANILKMLG